MFQWILASLSGFKDVTAISYGFNDFQFTLVKNIVTQIKLKMLNLIVIFTFPVVDLKYPF